MGNTEMVSIQTHLLATPDLTRPSAVQISLKAQLMSRSFRNYLEYSKSSLNVFNRFLETETLREMTYNENNFIIG